MEPKEIKIFSLGVDALTVEFGNEISRELNDRAVGLFRYFEDNPFAGMIETVPSYASLTVFFDVVKVRKNFPGFTTAFEAVKSLTQNALDNLAGAVDIKPRLIEIPVDFQKECGPDLDFVAAINDLTSEEVIEIFLSRTYRVFMLGFLPGFAYLGEISEKIAAPRKQTPRFKVPRGSIGIAGRQTGIYPLESPGGWQIIGRTEIEMFSPEKEDPCLLRAGDSVKFYAAEK